MNEIHEERRRVRASFRRQLGSPFPLLAAVGARTKKIEIGTAVIVPREFKKTRP